MRDPAGSGTEGEGRGIRAAAGAAQQERGRLLWNRREERESYKGLGFGWTSGERGGGASQNRGE